MAIALMADVKQQPIRTGRVGTEVINIVQRDRELDNAQIAG